MFNSFTEAYMEYLSRGYLTYHMSIGKIEISELTGEVHSRDAIIKGTEAELEDAETKITVLNDVLSMTRRANQAFPKRAKTTPEKPIRPAVSVWNRSMRYSVSFHILQARFLDSSELQYPAELSASSFLPSLC